MDAFERRWRLIELLLAGSKSRSWILDELAAAAGDEAGGLSGASLSSDVAELRKLGIGFAPLADDAKRSRQSYALDVDRLPVFTDRTGAQALLTASEVLYDLNLPEAAALEALFQRVPASVRAGLREAYDDHLVAPSITNYHPDVLRALQRGIASAAPMWIGYRSVGKVPRRYYVDRAYLAWFEGAIYLCAHCPREEGGTKVLRNREFRLDRFQKVDGHPAVEVLEGVRVAEPTVPTFELRLWAAPTLAQRLKPVTGYQKLVPLKDGGALVRTNEPVVLRAVRRVLSYGDLVRVLEPDFVKTELQATIGRMTANVDLADTAEEGSSDRLVELNSPLLS